MLKMVLFLSVFFFQLGIFGNYYSQASQDKFVHETFFQNKRNGIFVDIGAHKGIEISNTYFFESELDWDGICIEPIPELYDELILNRKCICIQGCIAETTGTASFIQFLGEGSWFSGLKDKFEENRLNLLADYGIKDYALVEVECFKLNDLLNSHGITHINFLSVDTEGGELDILKSIDFSKFQVDVITVENNYNDPSFATFMQSQGFSLVKKLHQDEVYLNKTFNQETAQIS